MPRKAKTGLRKGRTVGFYMNESAFLDLNAIVRVRDKDESHSQIVAMLITREARRLKIDPPVAEPLIT